MKNQGLFFSLIFLFFINVHAQEVEGRFDCTVTGNVVVGTEEGRFKTHSGYKGGVNVNDKVKLIYKTWQDSLYMSIDRMDAGTNPIVNLYITKSNANTTYEKIKGGGFFVNQKTNLFTNGATLKQDYIRIVNATSEVYFLRYYKNDWQGLFRDLDLVNFLSQTITLNCRHTSDNIDEAVKLFLK